MKSSFLLLSIAVAALSSCSSVYRSAQTPDDVYYSPSREVDAYVQTDRQERAGRRNEDSYYNFDNGYNSYEDRYLRMRVRNPYRWSMFDDYSYGWGMGAYSPYSYYGGMGYGSSAFYPYGGYGMGMGLGMGLGYGGYWNNYYGWNNAYNPYWGSFVVVSPSKNPAVYNRIRNFNMAGYTNSAGYNVNNARPSNRAGVRPLGAGGSNYNNTNTNGLGTSIRRVFSNGSNNNSANRGRDSYYTPSQYDRPSRSYTPSSSGSSYRPSTTTSSSSSGSSGSSSGGSGGGVGSRPARGN